MTEPTLYNIYWYDGCGNRDYVATTNNLDKWLRYNNEQREEPEELDDFEIEEAHPYIYEKKQEKIEFNQGELKKIYDSAETELYDHDKSSLVEMALESYVKNIISNWRLAFESGWVVCRKCNEDRGVCGCERPHIAVDE